MIHTTLISVATLAANLHAPDWLVVDCRHELSDPGKGECCYREGHIPGAVFADISRDLADTSKPGLGRHPLPDEVAFAAVLARLGWTPRHQVVVYDDAGGAFAARLWWMLRLVGHHAVAVLDGGIQAWTAAGLPLDTTLPSPRTGSIEVHYDRGQVLYYEALQDGLAAQSLRVLDARGAPRYRGEVEPIDRIGGHIPGAWNRPYMDNLGSDGRFKPADRLREEFAAVIGPFAPSAVAHSCGSGVTACHNLLAMEHAGLSGSRVFAPSWSGWSSDPSRPVATGAVP